MWLEQKYTMMISTRLRNFKRKGNIYNFSCPICGDSHSNKFKARGYIFQKKTVWMFHCHNCNASLRFANFLKQIDVQLYNEYKLENLKDKVPTEIEIFEAKLKKPNFIKNTPLKLLKKISQLHADHPCKQYVVSRKIPNPYHAKLFFCENFKHFTNNLIPGKFENVEHDESRLLIPFINRNGDLHAYQGRSLNPKSKVKYITIVLNEQVPKIYGLDTCNFDKTVYCFEGPIDSMFIPNSIACAGGDLISCLEDYSKDNIVIVYDNEPRSKETKAKIQKAIYNGYKVCIWPDNLETKDCNDMILKGLSPDFIKHIIDQNTYKDLSATLQLARWSKA